jgi:hypothetical protein
MSEAWEFIQSLTLLVFLAAWFVILPLIGLAWSVGVL